MYAKGTGKIRIRSERGHTTDPFWTGSGYARRTSNPTGNGYKRPKLVRNPQGVGDAETRLVSGDSALTHQDGGPDACLAYLESELTRMKEQV